MGKFCVTGGAGFIGSNLVESLVKRGHEVLVVDNLSTGRMTNLEPFRNRIEFIQEDICATQRMREVFSGVEVVFHEAALPSVQKSVLDPERSNQSNIGGTLAVLIAARDAKVRRVVLAGSSSVYGETPTLPKTESMIPQPISPYGVMKLVLELYARVFTRIYGLETICLRYFNVFGPRQDPTSEYSGVLSKFITALLNGKQPVIYGDGEQSRDFTYVENVVEANLLAADATQGVGETINVATGCRYSLIHVLEVLSKLISIHAEPVFAPPRQGDIKHSQADITRAQMVLGYTPPVDFETGLRRTVEWYRTQTGKGRPSLL
jgi:nucleoside-diphosphate-sugar epimerase